MTRLKHAIKPKASTAADIAGLALPVLFHNHRDIHAHHWAIVGNIWPLGAQDHHFLMGGGDGGRNLYNAAV